ncbi:MAG: T9SS type A sorting domain-containing protein [Saprospiraceae bacterium]
MRIAKLLLIIILWTALAPVSLSQKVEVKNHFFYLDGQKFFIKGIGYELGALPGQVPWDKKFDAAQIRFDAERILSGGSNTIRTWAPLTMQELNVLKDYDLKILMGIWIPPDGDFGDPVFIQEAKNIINSVVNYSRNYPQIIGYLIMNEPLPEHLSETGYEQAVHLWTQLIQIIHSKHPGRPVSISNTPAGDFIDPRIFDFSAYNVYLYNPVTVNHALCYQEYVHYLRDLSGSGHPVVITEFGLSVSPSGEGDWGYGGNTLVQQAEGVRYMYQSLVNGGATGSCVFNYSDGWWKAGNEWVHDDAAEEYFGLIQYSGTNDHKGTTRPVWDAVKAYQSVIITEPRSGNIYGNSVPLECFPGDDVGRIEIWKNDLLLKTINNPGRYVLTYVELEGTPYQDMILQFRCYDHQNGLIKTEDRSILVATENVKLPTVNISISNEEYWQTLHLKANYSIDVPAPFKRTSDIEYGFYPHIGFYYGVAYQKKTTSNHFNFSQENYFSDQVPVVTAAAGFDVILGQFKTRITNLITISKLNDVVSSLTRVSQPASVTLHPNPVSDFLSINLPQSDPASLFNYQIFDLTGRKCQAGRAQSMNEPIRVGHLSAGIYFVAIQSAKGIFAGAGRFVKR